MLFAKSYLRSLSCLALAGALVTGCSDDDENGGSDSGVRVDAGLDASTSLDATVAPVDGGDATDAAIRLSEAQVIGVAAAINATEIEAATLAQARAVSTGARDYATMMIAMHTATQQRQAALGIAPAPSPAQTTVNTLAAAALQRLQSTPAGSAFDAAYLQSQYSLHGNARDLIDSLLLPSATTAALRDELNRTRGEVVTHLKLAEMALRTLYDAGVPTNDGGLFGGLDGGADAGG
jgi:putative membrane protein